MAEKIVRLSTAQISKEVADFTIGLVKLVARAQVEDAVCAGSGTLRNDRKRARHTHGRLTS